MTPWSKSAFQAAVGSWGIQPADFWGMHPQEWWWLYEAKMPPPTDTLTEADKAELYEMLESMDHD